MAGPARTELSCQFRLRCHHAHRARPGTAVGNLPVGGKTKSIPPGAPRKYGASHRCPLGGGCGKHRRSQPGKRNNDVMDVSAPGPGIKRECHVVPEDDSVKEINGLVECARQSAVEAQLLHLVFGANSLMD